MTPSPKTEAASRRQAHVQDTRRALLDTARQLFAEKGLQATRTEDIVQRAGLTRGALYHHFRDKEDLFRAVHDELADEVIQLLRRRSDDRAGRSLGALPGQQRGLPRRGVDQPGLPPDLSRGRAGRARLALVVRAQRRADPAHRPLPTDAIAEGALEPQPVEPLAHLLAALGAGSAMYVAHDADPSEARRQIGLQRAVPLGPGRVRRPHEQSTRPQRSTTAPRDDLTTTDNTKPPRRGH